MSAAPPPHDARFREAAAEGRLLVQRCPRCGATPNFPRVACPRCFAELEWEEAAGEGTVEAFAVVHRPHAEQYRPHVPIVLALVALDAGPRIITSVVGDDRLETRVGSRVRRAREGWSALPQVCLNAR